MIQFAVYHPQQLKLWLYSYLTADTKVPVTVDITHLNTFIFKTVNSDYHKIHLNSAPRGHQFPHPKLKALLPTLKMSFSAVTHRGPALPSSKLRPWT